MSHYRYNPNPELLEVGQVVTTDFEHGAETVRRRVLDVIDDGPRHRFSSGVCVRLDAGEPCPACGRKLATATPLIDGSWAIPVTDEAGSAGSTPTSSQSSTTTGRV